MIVKIKSVFLESPFPIVDFTTECQSESPSPIPDLKCCVVLIRDSGEEYRGSTYLRYGDAGAL